MITLLAWTSMSRILSNFFMEMTTIAAAASVSGTAIPLGDMCEPTKRTTRPCGTEEVDNA